MANEGLPPNTSVSSFEELEFKEPTPSIAPSLYESAQYSRKWRVAIVLLVGGLLIALCILGFYMNAESRKAEYQSDVETGQDPAIVPPLSAPPKSVILDTKGEIKISKWRDTDSCDYLDDSCPEGYNSPVVLLVALDGVRSDMISETSAPALHHLSKCGVSADHLTPVYPSSTLPNLYTLVTGLYPESHGIIGPEIHNPETNKTFRDGKYESSKKYWWKGEPVWNTIKKKGLKSAMYFWPGADVRNGSHPTYSYKYRLESILDTRVNKVLEWLLSKEERISLIGVYFDYPNNVAKETGIFSSEASASLLDVDRQIDRLMTEIHNRNLSSCVNVVIVSNHGTAPATCGGFFLESFVTDIKEKARVVSGAVGRLEAIKGKATNKEIINQIRCKNPKLRALSKELLPTRYHFGNNKLIEGVILDTLPGNRIMTNTTSYCSKAENGFNNIELSMQGIFIARGPSFKTRMKTPGFSSVELYNLLCRLLHVTPAPNNGTEGSLFHILSGSSPSLPNVIFDSWHENIVPFLHKRAREDSFKEEIQTGINASTSSSMTAATSSPQTTVTPAEVPSTIAPTPSTTASSPATESSTASSTTMPSSTSASTPSPTTAPSASPVPNPTPPPTDPPASPEMETTPPASVVSTTQQTVVSQPSTPATTTSEVGTDNNSEGDSLAVAGEREAKMTKDNEEKPSKQEEVRHPNSPIAPAEEQTSEIPVVSTTAGKPSPIQEAEKVIVKIDEMSNSSMTSKDTQPSQENEDSTNSVSVVPKAETSAVDDSTQVTADVVETATTGSIVMSMEVKDPMIDTTTTTSSPVLSTTPVASSITISVAPTEMPSSAPTTVTQDVTEPSIIKESLITESVPISEAAEDVVSSTSSSPTTSSAVPSSTTPTTVESQVTNSSQLDVSDDQKSRDSSDSTSESISSRRRRKRQACDCASSGVLRSEAVRGEVASKDHINYHCPFGTPHYSSPDAPKGTHYILPHASHVTGYIGELGTSLWTSFTLTNQSLSAVEAEKPTIPSTTLEKAEVREVLPLNICWQADPRLPRDPQQQCIEYLEDDRYNTDNDTIRQLFPEELELREVLAREGFFLTNAIALKSSFVSGGRAGMTGLIKEWTRLRNIINVVSGPVWDRNLDGQVDTIINIRSRVEYLIPSHVFYLVSSCKPSSGFDAHETDLGQCPFDELDTMVFIFPNTELNDDCLMTAQEYSRYHLASVSDLQKMTGLQFFSIFDGMPKLPTLLAHQPLQLWQE